MNNVMRYTNKETVKSVKFPVSIDMQFTDSQSRDHRMYPSLEQNIYCVKRWKSQGLEGTELRKCTLKPLHSLQPQKFQVLL